ncbi:diffusible signal factor-reguated C1 family cysteine protease [Xanthomonas oryzae]|uniref:diffusible signal factor-reguated C1 family cysteine protease n=1 Tax=Xanthomonas oryzae TaxID=347 RepID=UPI00040882E6|nr:diffusible signal factor-reguated C1 family cysteine protease [Xanthomonas oryzae]ALS95383.1 peptidase C1 [Xanthomonas oryzae pv. oryzae]AUI90091.1 peptidase C1 [Xanthomonas oryzae pv. oryzae]AUI93770.1 peptidase C1 [Xanthomonas oryzae pv. oryzae]AUI97439.1 peptidase C1 [Xanthomonas oryzae pv. oryzae]AUJ01115.1 peptidase C1 [Xanthomonas oryzae pv. oryzae]
MNTHRSFALCLLATLSLTTTAAQAAVHGMGLKPSSLMQPVTPLFGTESVSKPLPASVDLTQWAITPGSQGPLASCASWAIGHTLTGWYANANKQAQNRFAPMYLYSQVNNGVDKGSTMEEPLDVALAQGIDTEQHYSWGNYDWKHKPTGADRANAAKNPTPYSKYTVLYSGDGNGGRALIEQIKLALASSTPVAIGLYVRLGFEELTPTNQVDYDIKTRILGGHAVVALGYDREGLIVENSWGTEWGNKGFGKLSWSVVAKDVIVADVVH